MTPLPNPTIVPQSLAVGLFNIYRRLKDEKHKHSFVSSLWFNVHTSLDDEERDACRKVIERINLNETA